MIARISLLFLPILAFAQPDPSPETNRELRGRVDAFYQNFLVNSFSPRKAEAFVAEDTKDYFYNAGKMKYESFAIVKITYSDNYTKAVVNVSGKTERLIAGQKVMMDVPQDTHWKIEDGKWCWTYDPANYSITPIPDSKNPPPATVETGVAVKPKDTSPKAIRDAGLSVLQQQQMGVDKTTVTVNVDQASSTEVVFTNGADGELQVGLDGPVVRGLTAKLDKMNIPGHGKAILTLHYDPSDKKSGKDIWEPKGSIEFRLIAAPFNRVFPVYVMFTASK
jgi:hypothetical protein